MPIKRTIRVFPVSLGSSTRNPYPDVTKAAAVWRPCGVDVKTELGVCSVSNLLDAQNPKDVLNEYSDATKPTAEELAMLNLRPGGSGSLHAYYVPRMSANNRGEAFLKINTPDLPEAVVVSDAAAEVDTLAHEIGHILLGNDHLDSEPDNVMAGGTRNYGVDKVKPEQCAKI